MTCLGDGSTGDQQRNWRFSNWARTRSIVVPLRLQPLGAQQIAAAVDDIERNGGVLKAIGSGWSYSDAAVAPEVTHLIDNSRLDRLLNGRDASIADAVIPFALNDTARARSRYFVHVETGIKIHALNCALDGMRDASGLGLAMPTLGGSNGQSLAGVISTGTHGGDIDLPPIADAVRAIHLVGPGGREWWIEPNGGAITSRERLVAARDAGLLCADIRIEYDDELFRAALVSVGRMGIIYSVVIEAVDAFRLREQRLASSWEIEASVIRDNIVNAAEPFSGPRFAEYVVSPYRNGSGVHGCVVSTRRIPTADVTTTPDGPPNPEPFELACDLAHLTPTLAALSAALPAIIAAAVGVALAGISWMIGIPFIGGLLFAAASTAVIATATTALVALETALIAALATPGENIAEKLANICNLAVAAGQKQLIPELVNAIFGLIRNPNAPPVTRESFRVMTSQEVCGAQRRELPECMRQIDGLEFAFDASPGSEALFDFINDVFALTDEFYNANRPAGFGISIRFCKATQALIGMQQYQRTASVEFLMLRGFDSHPDFIRRLHAIAFRHRGIPHWGLIHDLDARTTADLYGDNLTRWRFQLGRLIDAGGGRTSTFSTPFSIARNLEPLPSCIVPTSLVNIIRRILVRLAMARGMRRLVSPGEKRD
jgi:FAD/FMN-containing dehydrogenase